MNLRQRLLNFLFPPPPAPALAVPKAKPQKVSAVAVAEARGRESGPGRTWSVPDPLPGVVPHDKPTMAQDLALSDMYAWAASGQLSEGLYFPGYAYLAELSQRPEYRRISEILAKEMTRKWIKLTGEGDGQAERIKLLEKALKKFHVRALFRKAAEYDGFFGRSQLFVDTGDSESKRELSKPLLMNANKIGKGKLKGFKLVDPFWSYPGPYESTNPLHRDYYKPKSWYVMGSTVHASRMLTFVGRELPDMLKPAYSFGGLSLSQMAKPYVDNWLRTRQSVSDLVHSFSTMVLKTNMGAVLMGGGAESLLNRLAFYNLTRDNKGVMAVDKDTEELENLATPLGTLDKLQAQSQEQMASVVGIPLVVLLGVTPSGLNASSDGEIKVFYGWVNSFQEHLFRSHLETVINLIQLSEFGDIDPAIGFEFEGLWEMNETDAATVRKSDADVDVAYIGAGVLDPEMVLERLANDPGSKYHGVDLTPVAEGPPLPEDEEDDAQA